MTESSNPLLAEWQTPFGLAPFEQITVEHYAPAFAAAFAAHLDEIRQVVEDSRPATFENTIVALERSGETLRRIGDVFFNLTSSHTDEALQAVEADVMPRYSAHMSEIYTNVDLFARVNVVYATRDTLEGEALQLLEETQRAFVRAGAALDEAGRQRVSEIDETLAGLSTSFSQHILGDTNNYELVLESEAELDGLPKDVRDMAADEATRRGKPGKFVFTISRSSVTPFLQFSTRRDLREAIYRAYTQCGSGGDDNDNSKIALQIAALRRERATVMGFASHAAFMLEDRMAGEPTRVRQLLDQLWQPAGAKVRREADALQAHIVAEGGNFRLAPWDWWYYTEKVRISQFDLDETELKPFFELGRVRDGAFEVARKLYGICFVERDDVTGYHPDVTAWEVTEADGDVIGLFLTDYFMRPSKRGGAWMSNLREQTMLDGTVLPIVVNCCNFPQSAPCLLGMDQVRTLFHEFGHALHGLLTRVKYRSLSGTNVKQDFVELPSQIMEHWALEPDVLRQYARHIETEQPIPDALIEKVRKSETFNQGFATTEYLAACYLDLAWHGEEAVTGVESLEAEAMGAIGLTEMVAPRYHSRYFQHIFAGSHYSAGYYSYIWAEVLDADGYEAFRDNGIFDKSTAAAFREHVLEKGGTVDPSVLYRRFRGRDAVVGPLLRHRGLDEERPAA